MKNYLITKNRHEDRFIYLLDHIIPFMANLKYSWLYGNDDLHIKESIAKMIEQDVEKFTITIQTPTSAITI